MAFLLLVKRIAELITDATVKGYVHNPMYYGRTNHIWKCRRRPLENIFNWPLNRYGDRAHSRWTLPHHHSVCKFQCNCSFCGMEIQQMTAQFCVRYGRTSNEIPLMTGIRRWRSSLAKCVQRNCDSAHYRIMHWKCRHLWAASVKRYAHEFPNSMIFADVYIDAPHTCALKNILDVCSK